MTSARNLVRRKVQTARNGNVHKKLIKPRQNWACEGTKNAVK